MRILVIGGGGREHALCWRLRQTPGVEIHATPGNPGIAMEGTCHREGDPLAIAMSLNVDLTVVGPEGPLAAGIADRFLAAGRVIVGPVQAAARIESSKSFAKDLMRRAGIPTARAVTAESEREALDALKKFPLPVVLKADGLASGKGVIVARTETEARAGIASLWVAGSRLVIEEFLEGEEVSFIVLTDGRRALALEPSQDHKALCDGGTGPNTGGMGAYCDGRILSEGERQGVMDTVILPALDTMRRDGAPFAGFLYAGLMMTAAGPKVLEFNARLGDPEAQALLHGMESDFSEALMAAAHGSLEGVTPRSKPSPSVCVVLAAHGYPARSRKGDLIEGIEDSDATVFHSGTALSARGFETAGGRVLGVTASGADLAEAIGNAYRAVEGIRFDGMQYRRDIGGKGLKRWPESTYK